MSILYIVFYKDVVTPWSSFNVNYTSNVHFFIIVVLVYKYYFIFELFSLILTLLQTLYSAYTQPTILKWYSTHALYCSLVTGSCALPNIHLQVSREKGSKTSWRKGHHLVSNKSWVTSWLRGLTAIASLPASQLRCNPRPDPCTSRLQGQFFLPYDVPSRVQGSQLFIPHCFWKWSICGSVSCKAKVSI